MAVENAVALPDLLAGGVKDLLGDRDRADAGESDDTDATLLRHDGGGDRGDGFGLMKDGRSAQNGFKESMSLRGRGVFN